MKTFFELFEDQIDDADILSILLEWTQTQTSDFIRFLCRPLRMAVTESSTLMLFHLRDPVVITRMIQSNGNSVAISIPDNSGNMNTADSTGRKSLSPTPLQRRGSVSTNAILVLPMIFNYIKPYFCDIDSKIFCCNSRRKHQHFHEHSWRPIKFLWSNGRYDFNRPSDC